LAKIYFNVKYVLEYVFNYRVIKPLERLMHVIASHFIGRNTFLLLLILRQTRTILSADNGRGGSAAAGGRRPISTVCRVVGPVTDKIDFTVSCQQRGCSPENSGLLARSRSNKLFVFSYRYTFTLYIYIYIYIYTHKLCDLSDKEHM
jgi:hypothetical protein